MKKFWLQTEIYPGIYQKHVISKTCSVGRSKKNDIQITDASVSTKHAKIGINHDKLWIEDLDSSNGTLVNDVAIRKRYLEDGDLLVTGYINSIIHIDNDTPCTINIANDESIENDKLFQKEYVSFYFKTQEQQIEQFFHFAIEKIQQYFHENEGAVKQVVESLEAAIENAIVYGSQADPQKGLTCEIRLKGNKFIISVADEGAGFTFKPYLETSFKEQMQKTTGIVGISKIMEEVIFNAKGNEITMVKYLQPVGIDNFAQENSESNVERTVNVEYSMELTVRHVNIRYPMVMEQGKYHLCEVLVSKEEIKEFPENVGLLNFIPSFRKPNPLKVIPVIPGCITTPSFREIDANLSSVKMDFWITPITDEISQGTSIYIEKDSQMIECFKLSQEVQNKKSAGVLFIAASLIAILTMVAFPIQAPSGVSLGAGIGLVLAALLAVSALFVKMKKIGGETQTISNSIEF